MSAITNDDEILGKAYDARVTRRLLGYIRPYWRELLAAMGWMLFAMTGYVSGPYLIGLAIDRGIARGDVGQTATALGLYALSGLVFWIGTYMRINTMARTGQNIVYDLRNALFAHLQRLSLGFYSRYAVGRIVSRVVNDVTVVRELVVWALVAVVRSLVDLIGIIAAMVFLNAPLALLSFAVLPLMAIATEIFRRYARDSYRQVRSAVGWVNAVLNENIVGVRVVQAFSREPYNLERFSREINGNLLKATNWSALITSVFFPTVDLLGSLALTVVLYVGGLAVLGEGFWANAPITAGTLVAFTLYIDRFFNPIRDLSNRYNTFQATMASGERIFELLDTPIDVEDQRDARVMPPITGEVEFRGVSLRYRPDLPPVLHDLNVHVRPGMTVALVGETGAGKSSIVRLVSRFYDVSEGQLLIDGIDIRTVTQESLRQQMGVVLQDPFLFSGTVRENLTYARPGASDREIEEAARAVGAHAFILALENGYATRVGEGGAILSGGQRQLISFARALLADPRILILDEATASIDTQTERVIQTALERLLHGRTSFVIAHRLSTITRADLIVVMELGRIIETGTHAELLAKRGRYFEMYTLAFEGH
jgi:ATP-binding cassette subfamily B protein/subfamily B ATP-binding cassette protein MsbA